MSFMNAEKVTDYQSWLEIDGDNGTEFIPAYLVSQSEDYLQWLCDYPLDAFHPKLLDLTESYRENRNVRTITLTRGYGVRSSAAGYMDCTSWSVYSRKRDAIAAARQEQRECEGKDF